VRKGGGKEFFFICFLSKSQMARNAKNLNFNQIRNTLLGSGGLIALGGTGWALSNSLFNVEGGYRGVMFSRFGGVQDKIYAEGTHFMIPWIEKPVLFDVRAKPRNIASLTGTKGIETLTRFANGKHNRQSARKT
jgi:prohibitin 2